MVGAGTGHPGVVCGRYAASRGDDELVGLLGVDRVVGEGRGPSWNVAPTTGVRVAVDQVDGGVRVRTLRTVRWGLVPPWSKALSTGYTMINARAETITDRPAFRRAASRQRALVPMDGYYEWQGVDGGGRQAWYLTGPEGGLLVAAGLYERWADPGREESDPDRWVWSVAVVTTAATDAAGQVHDRSPLLLPADLREAWTDPATTDTAEVRALVRAVPPARLVPVRVSPGVGSVRNDGPDLVVPTGS